jgi:hypothetical protein
MFQQELSKEEDVITLTPYEKQFVAEFEKRFIGSGGDVTLSYTNGTDAMEVS